MPPLSRKLAAPPLFLLALACLLCAALARVPRRAAARAQDYTLRPLRQTQEEPRAAVYGRAVYEGTGRPVRRARVMLVGAEGSRPELNALTDGRGEFRITKVPAGSYYAFVDVPGVISPLAFVSVGDLYRGSQDFRGAANFLDAVETDGKEDKQVTVHARRGAALSGKVTYADGDPAVSVSVFAMRRGEDGRLLKFLTGANLVALSGLRTDDRGAYRIAGLPPGEYVVAVTETAEHGDAGRTRSDDFSGAMEGLISQQLLVTFYPSAAGAKDATALKLDAGDERADVDITIPERELHAISGYVRGQRDKRPLAGARVTLSRKEDELGQPSAPDYVMREYGQNVSTTDEEGRWQFKEIPDGRYTLSVKPREEYESEDAMNYNASANVSVTSANVSITNANVTVVANGNAAVYSPPRRKRTYAPARREVNVSGGDVSEVAVELSDGGRITGVITVEGGSAPQFAHVIAMRVAEGAVDPSELVAESAPAPGGAFDIEGLQEGKYFLDPSVYNSGASDDKLYVKSITWNGLDLLHAPLEIGDGTAADGVRIVFARNPATLSVRATRAADKTPAREVLVFLVPANVSEWSLLSQQLFCSTGNGGACTINAPPGDYAVVALPRPKGPGPSEMEAEIKRRAAASPRVSLRAGETKEFETAVPAGS